MALRNGVRGFGMWYMDSGWWFVDRDLAQNLVGAENTIISKARITQNLVKA